MTAAKRAGALFETAIVRHLRDRGLTAERLPKAGANDEGDVVFEDANGSRFVAELKVRREKTTQLSLGAFLAEAERESLAYASARLLHDGAPIPVVFVKRSNKPLDETFVVLRLKDFIA